MKTPGNLAVAVAVGGGLFAALTIAEASAPGLDFGAVKFVLPLVLGTGLFTALTRQASNRKTPVASDARKSDMLTFSDRPGRGWVVVMRDKSVATGAMGFDVLVDEAVVVQLMAPRFTIVDLPEGAHRLSVHVPGAPSDFAVEPRDIAVSPGAILIFAIRSSMGLTRTKLTFEPVPDTPAQRAALARMQMVESRRGGDD